MSKKRKTRKQKEEAVKRHSQETSHIHIASAPTYSVSSVTANVASTPARVQRTNSQTSLTDYAYLRKDMVSIAAASGIILAFDALLLVLLKSGVLRLGFLGY